MPLPTKRPEKENVALSYLRAEELLTPVVGKLEHQHPADSKVPSWDFDSLSFTHLVFPYQERRIKVVGQDRPDALDVAVSSDHFLDAVRALVEGGWGYLASVVGIDLGPEASQFEVLYLFCEGAAVLALTVRLSREEAVIPSICGLIPSASFFERELSEMFGITVAGTPNPDRLFLPDEWPDEVYPLRKDFEMLAMGSDKDE